MSSDINDDLHELQKVIDSTEKGISHLEDDVEYFNKVIEAERMYMNFPKVRHKKGDLLTVGLLREIIYGIPVTWDHFQLQLEIDGKVYDVCPDTRTYRRNVVTLNLITRGIDYGKD